MKLLLRMRNSLFLVFGSLFLLFENFKGPKSVVEIKDVSNALGHLVGVHVMGYEISIYCQRIHYHTVYVWKLWRNQHSVYRVFSAVTKDAPPALIKACELDVPFPAFYPRFVPERMQVKAAIDAYLDLLATRAEHYNKNA